MGDYRLPVLFSYSNLTPHLFQSSAVLQIAVIGYGYFVCIMQPVQRTKVLPGRHVLSMFLPVFRLSSKCNAPMPGRATVLTVRVTACGVSQMTDSSDIIKLLNHKPLTTSSRCAYKQLLTSKPSSADKLLLTQLSSLRSH